jgi:hypothetical protein
MPALNGTGPRGEGPMTGRGQGNCTATNNQLAAIGTGLGPCGNGVPRGRGRGMGIGRGMRPRFNRALRSV